VAVVAQAQGERVTADGAGSRSRAARFPCFDGLRALAALAVVAFHSTVILRIQDPRFIPLGVQTWLSPLGSYGVAVFFVISGFLLYRPYALAMLEGRPGPELLPFWQRRFFRIFPAYWVALAVAVFVFSQTGVKSFGQAITTFGLIQNYRYGYQLMGLGVAWTLVIELSFYLTLPGFAWVMRTLCNRSENPRFKLAVQLVSLAGLAAFTLALRYWYLFQDVGLRARGAWFTLPSLRFWLPMFLDWFAIGMAFAVGASWLATGGRIPRVIAFFGRVPAISWLVALECYWIVVQTHVSAFSELPGASASQDYLRFLFLGLAAGFFVLPAVFGEQTHGTIRWMLRTRVLVALGVISYGIYLWHMPIWLQLQTWLPHGLPMVAQVGIELGATVLVAAVSWELIERPVVRWSTGKLPVSLFRGHTVAPRWDHDQGERPRAHLAIAFVIVALAVFALLISTADLTLRGANGSPDDFGWRGPKAAAWDDFHRPDQMGLGTAQTGQPWIPLSGSWSISGHRAVVTGVGFAIVRVPATHLRTTGSGLAFRCPDARNCWWIDPVPESSTWNVHKIFNGRIFEMGNLGVVRATPTSVLAVHLDGEKVEISIDGTIRRVIDDKTLMGAVGVGLANVHTQAAVSWPSFEADR
jgi:peptidoglycan/LPS O-acetylase OafA/YrhL